MLIYTYSLNLQLPACIAIHNQCSNIELVAPVYFGNGAVCSKLSDQKICIGAKMNASFEISALQDELEGALLFKLQRYSDCQYNMSASAAETNETTCIRMLVAWKVKDSKPFIYVVLIEHTKGFTWNEDELRKLYNKNHNRLKEHNDTMSDVWFIDDEIALKISFKIIGLKANFGLSISISEEEKDIYAMRPFCIDLER
jgi:hypothetical protein